MVMATSPSIWSMFYLAAFPLALLALWVGTLVHARRTSNLGPRSRLAWTLVILFTGPIGALFYLVAVPGSREDAAEGE